MIEINIKFLPLSLSAKEAATYIGAGKLFEDMRAAKWILPIVSRNKMVLFDRTELETCYARVRAGEYPASLAD